MNTTIENQYQQNEKSNKSDKLHKLHLIINPLFINPILQNLQMKLKDLHLKKTPFSLRITI